MHFIVKVQQNHVKRNNPTEVDYFSFEKQIKRKGVFVFVFVGVFV